ncbi:ASB_HP2_G0034460.mRNA.1.CDS.1 [Saccharomyces cerevisiae]|nr:ASB_HP2_G0034460.mRNA.1.CDS.1 [Saccharomyces cerevisiae]CAI6629884.1 ASB_HP1_G0033700.mRNA.1.CDS.1 [Saccharomyces cerevisiae]CAI6637358.1 ASB_HP2_G0034460.mRNA.1.CDS.1 [Saccharomyces cerevisiae]
MSFLWGSTKSKKGKNKKAAGSLPSGVVPQQRVKPTRKNVPIDYPRTLEKVHGESLIFRTSLLSELVSTGKSGIGPPDLIHCTELDKFHDEKIGEFFYITGIDASSVSMPIAFLKLIKWNDGKKLKSASLKNDDITTYCTFNIFQKLDIRLRYESEDVYQVNIVDCLNGNNEIPLSDLIWEETFVSCCIRSVIINSDFERKIPGLVELPFVFENRCASDYKRVIDSLCKFLPRFLECGWDSTKSVYATILNNYLTESLLVFLSITPEFITDYAIQVLDNLMTNDPSNSRYYAIVIISIMERSNDRDVEMIKRIHEILDLLLPVLYGLPSDEPYISDLINCITDVLSIQARFLLNNNDYELSLSISTLATNLSSDNFESWYLLSKGYIFSQQYDKALLSINSMPCLAEYDIVKQAQINAFKFYMNYYKAPLCHSREHCTMTSHELNHLMNIMHYENELELKTIIFGRTVMPNESKYGCIEEIWNKSCLELGPICGPQSDNLINFVSQQEVNTVGDMLLLKRSKETRQESWFIKQVRLLLMELVARIGWNALLQLRSDVFVMESKFKMIESSDKLSTELRQKRLCQRWFDAMFLDVYEDLSISTSSQENKATAKYSGLEWELLGLTLLRVSDLSDAVACLRTSILARFDPISCHHLLNFYLTMDFNDEFMRRFDVDIILDLLVKLISFRIRFYDRFQIFSLQVLRKLEGQLGSEIIKNKIINSPYGQAGITSVIDYMLECLSKNRNEACLAYERPLPDLPSTIKPLAD